MRTPPVSAKRSRRPLVVMGWLMLALVAFWVLVFAGLMLHPRSRAVIDAAVRFTRTFTAGMDAPGTGALLALGCDQAAVFPVGEALALIQEIGPGPADAELSPAAAEAPLVFCRKQAGSTARPSCRDVARVYSAEARPQGRFLVVVHQPGDTRCTGFFDAEGRWLADLEAELAPPTPQAMGDDAVAAQAEW
jgi:hypothetical protein